MQKKLYPCPSYEGIDDSGEDVFTVFLAWFDETVGGFPIEQPDDDRVAVFYGSYDECCDYLKKHGC